MKKFIIIIILFASRICYCQQLPGLSATATKGIQDYMKRSTDSLRVVIRKEIADSLAKFPVISKGATDSVKNLSTYLKPVTEFATYKASNDTKVTSLEGSRTVMLDSLGKVNTKAATALSKVLAIELADFGKQIGLTNEQVAAIKAWMDRMKLNGNVNINFQ